MVKPKLNARALIFSFVIVFIVAFMGSLFTDIGPWYESVKPSITPPSFVFPIAWTILFILIALSLYFALVNSKNKGQKKKIAWVYGLNFILNILWSLLFFTLKKPKLAFAEIIILWLSIAGMILVSWKIDKKAGWLLLPYLLWVAFASVLTFLIAF